MKLELAKMRLFTPHAYSVVLLMLGNVHIVISTLFLDRCTYGMMWNLRAKNFCGARDKYMCLYDTNKRKFRELCKDEPEFHRQGNIFVISGNLQYFAGRPCNGIRYQPHIWWTNGSSECQYLKSTCNEEGQVQYDNGTITTDRKCRCDYTNYYTFVSSTRNKCYCDPTEEDCLCYRKKCNPDEVLSPDYDCVSIHAWTGRFVCPEYKAPRFTDKRLPRSTTTCPLPVTDVSGTKQQREARIAYTTLVAVIIIIGVTTIVFAIIRALTQEDIQNNLKADLEKELRARDFYKIKLLKNYHLILKEIKPTDIILKLPYHIISGRDRDDIQNMSTKNQQIMTLIHILINSDESGYTSFLDVLSRNENTSLLASTIAATQVNFNDTIKDYNHLFRDLIPETQKREEKMKEKLKNKVQAFIIKEWRAGEKAAEQEDVIPQNIRVQHEQDILKWEKDEQTFVETSATHHLLAYLPLHDCIVVTGNAASGKSSNIHFAALHLRDKYGYEIIPILTGPSDILNYNKKTKKQVFVIDDICGKEVINRQTLKVWRDYSGYLEKIFTTGEKYVDNKIELDVSKEILGKKLLISCRQNIYADSQFQLVTLLTRKECNLSSPGLCLLLKEKYLIMKEYIPADIFRKVKKFASSVDNRELFLLLCKLSEKKTSKEIIGLFKSPVDSIRDGITDIIRGNTVKCCALVLIVLFDDGFNTDWLTLEFAPVIKKEKLEGIFKEFEIDLSEKAHTNLLKASLYSLDGTYLQRTGTEYTMIHDQIYIMAAVICGQNHTECFIRYAPSIFVRDHFIFQSITDVPADNELIVISNDIEDKYFERLVVDLREFEVASTFNNRQLRYPSFIEKLIGFFNRSNEAKTILRKFDKQDYKEIKNNENTVLSFHTTPLIESASGGYLEIVRFLIETVKCDINKKDAKGRSPLYRASEGGNANVVEMLLTNNADVSQCDYKKNYPLHMACEAGHRATVDLLLENQADISLCNSFGESPLYVACKGGHTDIVTVLLDKHVNVFRYSSSGMSPLYVACKGGHTETVQHLLKNHRIYDIDHKKKAILRMACEAGYTDIVELLLKDNADVSLFNSDGDSLLNVACEKGNSDIVNHLLNAKADVFLCNSIGDSPLHVACGKENQDIVTRLLSAKADVSLQNGNGDSPLHVACGKGHRFIVKQLLNAKSDVGLLNDNGHSPLYVACEGGHIETVKLLLENHADVFQCNSNFDYPLHVASRRGHTESVKVLLDNKADVFLCNGDGNSPLYVACEGGHKETVNILLENHADVFQCNSDGNSPLNIACKGGHTETVKLLLLQKADVFQSNIFGNSPLHVACEGGQGGTVQLLLANNANISECNRYGESPLHVASEGGHTDTVRLLLGYNADNVNQCNNYGDSPLHVAVENDYADTSKLLLQTNADFSLCNRDGDSPLHVACRVGNKSTVKLLMQYKANIIQCNKFGYTPLEVAYNEGHADIMELLLQD